MAGRFVALGDSFTEGVGDVNRKLPNGVRGWADRVAERLARAEPGWEYANLAIRSKRLRQIVAEQLDPAISMEPTLISLYAGGNDILDLRTDMEALMAEYDAAVARLAASGARLLLFTGFDVNVSRLLGPFRRRNFYYNERVREAARRHNALLVDYWAFDAYHDRRMWGPDRLHMSKAGHKYLAAQVLDVLDVEHSITPKDLGPLPPRQLSQLARENREWLREWVLPMFGRKMRGVTLGDNLQPRWPQPVRVPPKGGLKRLAGDPDLRSRM